MLRALDLTDELGAAAIRVLVGFGADVVRPDQPSGSRAARLHWYSGVRRVTENLDALAAAADVIIESGPRRSLRGVVDDRSRWPEKVHVVITPFGLTGPRRDWLADDLVAASAGGMTWLGGLPDGPPKPPPREQATQLAGVHGAIAAYLGILEQKPQLFDISVQEAVAATLETGAISWIHAGNFPRRTGGVYAHVAHRVFRAKDGFAAGGYSGSNRMWTDMLAWMDETGEAEDLTDEKWADAEYRWAHRPHVDAVVSRFAARRAAAELGEQGRERALPWAEVARADQLRDNPQLRSRDFFVALGDGLLDVGPAVRLPAGKATGRRSLNGLKVLDLTWVLAGPYATRQLAEHGADVIKVESRHRQDPTRFAPSMRLRPDAGFDDGGYFLNFNRDKRSVAINMRTPQGQALVRRLVAAADVVIDNYSPGMMARWGLGPEELEALNPNLIAVSMSGVGQTGPWRNAVTFADTLAAMSGLTAETADPGGNPQGLTFGLGDMVAANAAVTAILAMLADGRAGYVDLSQLEAMASAMGPALLEQQLGPEPGGEGQHGTFPTAGPDRWIAISVRTDAQRKALAELTGDDVAAWTATQDGGRLAERLQAAGIPAAVVNTGEDLVENDPQLAARGFYADVEHPLAGTVRVEGAVVKPAVTHRAAPLLGQHTADVLTELLGLTPDEIKKLADAGILE